jgi:hypothetical protein
MVSPPKTYDEWLALSDEERDEVHLHQWNAYERDGIAFAFMAAARLAMQSPHKVLDVKIGTYHCGEYLLRLTVSQEDHRNYPPMLTQTFEGFRVVWVREPGLPDDPFEHPLTGSWDSAGDGGDYRIQICVENDELAVRCGEGPDFEQEPMEFVPRGEDSIQFLSTFAGIERRHDLSPVAGEENRMHHEIATYHYAERRRTGDA